MPYKIRHRKGTKRPWKIMKVLKSGKMRTVGSSTTEREAWVAVRARYWAENK